MGKRLKKRGKQILTHTTPDPSAEDGISIAKRADKPLWDRCPSDSDWDGIFLICMEWLTLLFTYAMDHPLSGRDVIQLGIALCKALELSGPLSAAAVACPKRLPTIAWLRKCIKVMSMVSA